MKSETVALGLIVEPIVIEKANKRNIGSRFALTALAIAYAIGGPIRATKSLAAMADNKKEDVYLSWSPAHLWGQYRLRR